MKNQIKSLLSRPEISALVITIFLIIVCSFLSDRFLNARNFMVILAAYPEYALVALGVTILMISGEFDLSVGSDNDAATRESAATSPATSRKLLGQVPKPHQSLAFDSLDAPLEEGSGVSKGYSPSPRSNNDAVNATS